MIKPELLAPAGSMEALHAAVDNGADAVYLGVGSFNARANAQNFTMDDLPDAISYAHLHSVRIYLTLNTLLRDDEISGALSLAHTAHEIGADAVIVQDLGLLKLLAEQFPEIPVHASTQMNLYDQSSARWARDNHISRIVLPRELSMEEIRTRTLAAAVNGVETEIFIHGAMCVSYSGLCLFSAMNGNGQRSGNRGLCAQPCRTLFELRSNEGVEEAPGRLLSTKDQSALSYIKMLMDAGVHSLKIEGRMREPAYVAAVVRSYREYIDKVFEGNDSTDAQSQIQRHLLLAFNRGGSFTSQYLQGEKKGDLPAGKYSGRYGILLGIIVKKNARAGTLSLRLSVSDLPIRGDYLSIHVNDQEISSFPIGKLEKMGDVLVVMGLHPQMIEKIPDGALVYQMSELSYTRDLLSGKAAYKTPVTLHLENDEGIPSQVKLMLHVMDGMWKGMEASVTCTFSLETASSDFVYPELPHNRILEQLSKAKSSPFDVKDVEIDSSLVLCAPVSFVNEIRREGFSALEQTILLQKQPAGLTGASTPMSNEEPSRPVTCICGNDDPDAVTDSILHVNYYDLRRLLPQKLGVRANYYSFSVYDLSQAQVHLALAALHEEEPSAEFLIWLPGAYKDSLLPIIEKSVDFMKNEYPDSYAGIVTSNTSSQGKTAWINASANIYNHEALCKVLTSKPFSVAVSYELKDQNVIELLSEIPENCFASAYLSLHRYGRIEWMQSEFCPVGRHEDDCRKCRDKDRSYSLQILSPDDAEPVKGKDLPVITHAGLCTSEILGPLHVPAGSDLLKACKEKQIPVAHTVRFLDEPYDVRRHIVNEILSEISE